MYENFAKLILRITVGGLLFMHGLHKVMNGNDFVVSAVKAAGLPEFIAWGVYVGEVAAPLLLIAGIYARIAAVVIAGNMFMSVVLSHRDIMFSRNEFGGLSIELNIFFFATAVALVLFGPGDYALQRND